MAPLRPAPPPRQPPPPPPPPSLLADAGESLPLALYLSTLSGLATVLGALVVCWSKTNMTTRSLGLSQGMAAGFMIAVTLGEILPEALSGVTVWQCMIYFCTGAIAIYLLKHLLPEPDLDIFLGGNPSSGDGQRSTGNEAKRQPSLSWSGGGGDTEADSSGSNRTQLNHHHHHHHDHHHHHHQTATLMERPQRNKILWSGLLTAMSLAAHNFPEGVATFVAALKGLTFGLPLTIAIALHNVPEGAACALPVYLATRSRRKAVLVAFLSGLAEPLGVVFVYAMGPAFLTPHAVGALLAVVGGIMGGLSIFELAPQSVELTSKRDALASVGLGFVLMSLVLGILHV